MHSMIRKMLDSFENHGKMLVPVSEVPEMVPVMWCAAAIVHNGRQWLYVDNWRPVYTLIEDLEKGRPGIVDISLEHVDVDALNEKYADTWWTEINFKFRG